MTERDSELTFAQAKNRGEALSNCRYEIELDLNYSDVEFLSTTRARFSASVDSVFIDSVAVRLNRAVLNGKDLDLATSYNGRRLQLKGLLADNELVVEGVFAFTNTGDGMHRFVDPLDASVYVYCLFEPNYARQVFTVFDQPDIKATFSFRVSAPEDWTVLSNTPVKKSEDSLWSFYPSEAMAPYATTIVGGRLCGRFDEYKSRDGRTIELGIWCRQSLAKYLDADYLFAITKKGMAFYEEKFDYPCPFPKYDQVFCPEYYWGAMESTGCVTINERILFRGQVDNYLRERRVITVLHELAHMWFGNLVTMKWWGDLWLNESFAEFVSTLATAEVSEWKNAWATFASVEKSWAYRQDRAPTTHPVVDRADTVEAAMTNFDGITYAKGASILKQLAHWVGVEKFFAGVANYFKKYAFGNTTFDDLLACICDASGRDLRAWADSWLKTCGVPEVKTEITEAGGSIKELVIKQEASPQRDQRLAVGFYELRNRKLVCDQSFEVDIREGRAEVDRARNLSRPDLILLNDKDLGYTRICLDKRSLETVYQRLRDLEDPLARAVIWTGLWEGVSDLHISYKAYIDLVLNHFQVEVDSTLKTIFAFLVRALTVYTPAGNRQEAIDRAMIKLWQGFERSEDFSDQKFQTLNLIASMAQTDKDLERLRSMLSNPVEGIRLDSDLRWNILAALAAADWIGENEIAAELAKNPTATDAELAVKVRACRPAGKYPAWKEIFGSDSLPNSRLAKLCEGFMRLGDPFLMEPFVERYFEQVRPFCQPKGNTASNLVVPGLYPLPLVSDQLVNLTKNWLEDNADAPYRLIRRMRENLHEAQLVDNLQRTWG